MALSSWRPACSISAASSIKRRTWLSASVRRFPKSGTILAACHRSSMALSNSIFLSVRAACEALSLRSRQVFAASSNSGVSRLTWSAPVFSLRAFEPSAVSAAALSASLTRWMERSLLSLAVRKSSSLPALTLPTTQSCDSFASWMAATSFALDVVSVDTTRRLMESPTFFAASANWRCLAGFLASVTSSRKPFTRFSMVSAMLLMQLVISTWKSDSLLSSAICCAFPTTRLVFSAMLSQ
mmetsp:Transcript_11905/g.30094  ORF Transcript_11905/g.30094 Transcript_11905/m.30094 type:complete len:240 (+) Transcript_11905:2019-2738(+)